MRPEPKKPKIDIRPSGAPEKPVRRSFPGPRASGVELRVAFERAAYADLIAHAKASLDTEVCGVLAGRICADDEGNFVHVETIVRGSAASEAATHVTFTQATWDSIHRTLDQDYPNLRIVGWYHTHPGFGVEFSDMDLFIQQNFFSGAAQIGFVIDPLSGAVAIIANATSGIEYLPRFWVDGREQVSQTRTVAKPTGGTETSSATPTEGEAIKRLEDRISQLIQAQDDQRTSFYRFLYTIGFIVAFGMIAAVGYSIYSQYVSRNEPPRVNSFVPIPVQFGDKTVMVGVGVVQWDVPPELDSLLIKAAKLRLEEEKNPQARIAKPNANASLSPTNAAPPNQPQPPVRP